jgi:hypothetical protein
LPIHLLCFGFRPQLSDDGRCEHGASLAACARTAAAPVWLKNTEINLLKSL